MSFVSTARHPISLRRFSEEKFLQLATRLESDVEFCMLLQPETNNQDARINKMIEDHAEAIRYMIPASEIPLNYVKSHLGSLVSSAPVSPPVMHLQQLFQTHTKAKRSEHRRRQHVIQRLGIVQNNSELPKLREFYVSRLPDGSEYPPRDHYILESYLPSACDPLPPKKKDPTCAHRSAFHHLDETKLSHQLAQTESGIYKDKDSGEIICIVIRNFVQKDYFPVLQEWGTALVKDSINRRRLCQRNTPDGQLAQVGVSGGPRSVGIFGWVRNLLCKNAPDHYQHEKNIASLFGIFYAVLRSRVAWLTNRYEKVMADSAMPRLDQTGCNQFTLPFGCPVTFRGYPLALPEGYIAVNYKKWIHKDTHWKGCPWACYWNLTREQKDDKIGPESGASFFISDYGIRIINAANTCVIWNVSLWHGTGYYNNNVSQVGIALLLSEAIQNAWQAYQKKVEKNELREGDLLWYIEEEDL
jgi:hypothetical protein